MRIQPTNYEYKRPNFKSAFPVVHWVAETNGSYAPVANMKLVKNLQGKLIRFLNKPLKDSAKPMNQTEQKIRAYIGSCDTDYRNMPHVRSFYNHKDSNVSQYTPISYIITGDDVAIFEDTLSKNIGRSKRVDNIGALDTKDALQAYNKGGMNFVKNYNRQIKDRDGIPYILHTKFEIIRNTLGKIKDYRILDVRFLPSKGPKNPLERF